MGRMGRGDKRRECEELWLILLNIVKLVRGVRNNGLANPKLTN